MCGKPHAPARGLVAALVGDGEVVVVGDRPETDVALAKAEGWASALVLTGVTDPTAAVANATGADVVLSSVRDLPLHLGLDG